jgi:gluconate 2-dehydrogenase gamma chain
VRAAGRGRPHARLDFIRSDASFFDGMRKRTRREFCEEALFGVGACVALSAIGCHSRSSGAPSAPEAGDDAAPSAGLQPRTLSPAAFATLSAVCDRILPRDDDPGAIDLGVPAYIDAMIATPDLTNVREMFWKVFPILDKEAGQKFGGKLFADLAPGEQDAILDTWQNGKESRQKFFEITLTLTLEGAFGDPKYGGNMGGLGFKMIGFTPDPPLKKMASMPGMSPPAPAISSGPAHNHASHP